MSAVPMLQPMDDANRALLEHVHPSAWRNPEPASRYNLVVIGAGSAGLISAAVAAGLGARVALVERQFLGGDCLNVGCVPSKALIRAGRIVHEARRAKRFGMAPAASAEPDFAAAMERMRRIRAEIAPNDSALRYRDELGVDVFLGDATFAAGDRVEVDDLPLVFSKAIIATGGRATAPPIPGLSEAGYLTNETVFSLTGAPRRLAVIGGGPIGCELAQAFCRLGSDVTILEMADQVLNREDPDAAAIVEGALRRDGVHLEMSASIERIETTAAGKQLVLGDGKSVIVDDILVAAGRAPNLENLGLERAGVAFGRRGVEIDDTLRTSNRHIYAVGDCAMRWQFTHAADAAAKIAVQNALFFGRKRLSSLVMPWCTYTDPEIGHIGLYESEANERGIAVDRYEVPMAENDRALCDGEEEGFVKILTAKGKDKILGATIVASHAGDLIGALSLAMAGGAGLSAMAGAILPYPTQAEVIKTAANRYMRTRLTPRVAALFDRFLAWRR